MRHIRLALRWLLAAALGLMACAVLAQNLLDVPALTSRVVDQTGTLSPEQRQALTEKLTALETRKGSQLVVLIVPTTQPEDMASYTNRVANTWKIGRKGVGDGLLLVVAKNDRKLRIEVAKTLEGAITDLQAKRVIDQEITPRFKQGDFAGGIAKGVEALIKLVDGEALPTPADSAGAAEDLAPGELSTVLGMMGVIYSVLGLVMLGAMGVRRGISALMMFATSSAVLLAPTWLVSHDEGAALAAGFLGIPVALIVYAIAHADNRVRRTTKSTSDDQDYSRSSSGSSFSSSDSGSSSSSDSFSSGGGGDFGGGGASGDW